LLYIFTLNSVSVTNVSEIHLPAVLVSETAGIKFNKNLSIL
jgi:hypothetical protein